MEHYKIDGCLLFILFDQDCPACSVLRTCVCIRCISEKHRHQSFIKMHEVFLPHQNQNSLILVSIYTEPIKGRKYILIRIRFLFRIFKSSMNKIAIYIEIRIIKSTRIYKSCQALDKYLFIPLSIPEATDIHCLSVFLFFVSLLTVRVKTLRWIDSKWLENAFSVVF